MLKGKKIILGVTGSIAAYKSAFLLRLLAKEGAEVQVIMTAAGKEFISPVTMSALSNKPVLGEFFQSGDGTWHSHVDIGLWADLMVIAPASANTIAKMAVGICDNLLLTTFLSAKCPIMVAPAMDLDMFQHPATKQNIYKLQEYGCQIIEPCEGELASGLFGKGRMEEPEVIVDKIRLFFKSESIKATFNGKSVLVTAGPTHEQIDPVRFIGNHSSGKMGYALAEELALRGAKVYLVSGLSNLKVKHPSIQLVKVGSASQMFDACHKYVDLVDAMIFAAAVSDYTIANPSKEKIKRAGDEMIIKLTPTKDIAAEIGKLKKAKQISIGFALETNDMIENATKKLKSKNLDFIVMNAANNEHSGFNVDTNQITIIEKNNKITEYPLKQKVDVAVDIVDKLDSYLI